MIAVLKEVMLAVSNSLAASIVVKATVLIALGLTGATISHKSRAAVRHALLAVAFGMLLALPVASIVAPPIRIELPPIAKQRIVPAYSEIAIAPPAGMRASVSAPAPPTKLSMMDLLLAGWIAGMALFLLPALIGFWQVRSLRRSALPWPHGQAAMDHLTREAGIRRRVAVLRHERLPGPMTCGTVHPAIMLPLEAEGWKAEDLNRAIVHELEHARRGDWVSQCLARAVCGLYWFHPLVWMAWRRLKLEAERSCDDAVLGHSDATAYADQLIALAQRLSSAGISPRLAMVSRSDLATRIHAVLDNRQRRGRAGKLSIVFASAAAAVLVLIMSPVRMVAAPQSAVEVAEAAPVSVPTIETTLQDTALPADATPVPQPVAEPTPQNAGPIPQASPGPQFAVSSLLVNADVFVTDSNSQSIDGLGANDFVITEDGVPQTISFFEFQRMADPPVGTPSSFYTLGYYASNQEQDGRFRKIRIICKNDASAKVTYRSGYYASKHFVNASGFIDASADAIAPGVALPPGNLLPVLVFGQEPEYSEEARKAKHQGTVTLSVEVTDTGSVTHISVLRSLGLGLDEKAIEAVKQWKFKPGTVNGRPVTMQTQVKVAFRLL